LVSQFKSEAKDAQYRFLSRRLKMQHLQQELAALAAEEESARRAAEAELNAGRKSSAAIAAPEHPQAGS
jgi:hypothetical protein